MVKRAFCLVIVSIMVFTLGLVSVSAETLPANTEAVVIEAQTEGEGTTVTEPGVSGKTDSETPDNPGSVDSGQERTMVYVGVAMMAISAAVIFFARRNRALSVS